MDLLNRVRNLVEDAALKAYDRNRHDAVACVRRAVVRSMGVVREELNPEDVSFYTVDVSMKEGSDDAVGVEVTITDRGVSSQLFRPLACEIVTRKVAGRLEGFAGMGSSDVFTVKYASPNKDCESVRRAGEELHAKAADAIMSVGLGVMPHVSYDEGRGMFSVRVGRLRYAVDACIDRVEEAIIPDGVVKFSFVVSVVDDFPSVSTIIDRECSLDVPVSASSGKFKAESATCAASEVSYQRVPLSWQPSAIERPLISPGRIRFVHNADELCAVGTEASGRSSAASSAGDVRACVSEIREELDRMIEHISQEYSRDPFEP